MVNEHSNDSSPSGTPEESAPEDHPEQRTPPLPEEQVLARNEARKIDYDPEEFGLDELDEVNIYEHHRIQVDPGQKPMRVDQFLTERLKSVSRSRIKSASLAGFIRVNSEPVKASYKVKPYEEVSIILPFPPENALVPQDIPLDIHYEDEDVVMINKPPGMVVHPGAGNHDGTLANALLFHFRNNLAIPEDERNAMRPGLVHRIDKETSGLLAVAKNEHAYNHLSRQFFNRTTQRRYYALVWGDVKDDAGTVVGHIGRATNDRVRYRVFENGNMGRHAITHYEVVQRFGVCTLVRCKLETGRTHQIRVHMKYLGHTLFNDSVYGGHRLLRGKPSKAFQRFIHECFDLCPRQALHAKTLGFEHPRTGEFVHFECELPADMRRLLLRMALFFQVEPLPELEPYREAFLEELEARKNSG